LKYFPARRQVRVAQAASVPDDFTLQVGSSLRQKRDSAAHLTGIVKIEKSSLAKMRQPQKSAGG